MSLATKSIQLTLFSEILLFSLLLIPFPIKIRNKLIFYLTLSKALFQIICGIQLMVLFTFMDSLYKITTDYYSIYYERNAYISGFTLFLFLVYTTFLSLIKKIIKEEENAAILTKQVINQKEFVEKMMKDLKDKDTELINNKKSLQAAKILATQVENNQKTYFDLLTKYNELKGETTKNK
ncbi:hypothetical protein SLOPH_1713 [Spraguea lophii 42_110]|uniref:Endoplasmic reticulum transmembrane protein n=1 Tax=Spraguea lophii (strain 42_110) TaxID=1358809 RepID=S7XH23_SPRLO|nr:hypothetical protein SLOPH_1713 [Spraguea lophii 42_110]